MTMETQAQAMSLMPRREPWNKGKLIGQKPPLRPKHVSSIRTRLQMEGRTRDLAMFNLAIDSKLRACDPCAAASPRHLRRRPGARPYHRDPEENWSTGPVRNLRTDRHRSETGSPTSTHGTGDYLFPSRFRAQPHLSTRQYARSCRRGSRALGSIARPM